MKGAGLTDNEGALLALVVRAEPITAYQIGQVYGLSPVTNFNTSKGKLYAIIRRLADRGLLKATPVESDRRGTERLAATAAGRAAVRAWVKSARSEHLLLEDPLRTKIQSFDLLSPQERVDWCMRAKAMLEEKLREVDAYGDRVDVPFQDLVHDGAVSAIKARIAWLDRVLLKLLMSNPAQADHSDRNGANEAALITRSR